MLTVIVCFTDISDIYDLLKYDESINSTLNTVQIISSGS